MDEEIRFHLEMQTEKNLRAGMDPREARRRALMAFGGLDRHRDALREGRRVPLLEPTWQDLRFGVRFLARAPGLSLVAAVTVALGVAATTTVFSAVNAMLLRPLPLPAVERLASIQESREGDVSAGWEGMRIPYGRVLAYREATGDIFESVAAHRLEESFSLGLSDATVAVNGALTSGNYFQTLGVQPALGRTYASDDALEIVISHGLWTSRFGRDPGVLGQTVRLDGRTVTVVGVAPAGFAGATFIADQLWAPVGIRGVTSESRDVRMVPVGRLRPDVTLEHAVARVDAVGRGTPPEENVAMRGAQLDPLSMVPTGVRGPVAGFFAILFGMALMVLLIAAANIAAVMLARGFARRREMAVRLAIGASRGRVVRHLLAESLMIFAVGWVAGVGLAYLGTAWLSGMEIPPQAPPLLVDFSPDHRVLAFAVALTGMTGMFFGLVPALQSSRPELVPALKSGSAGALGGEGRARDLFVGVQVALTVALLLTATLFARSLQAGLESDVGFEPSGVVAAAIDLGPPLDYGRERGRGFHEMLLERIRATPGVEAAALSQDVLLSGHRSGGPVRRSDMPEMPSVNTSASSVSPGYFETVGIELIAGRDFTEADAEGAAPVVVINQTLADRLWPGENPIGQHLAIPGPAEVVGVTTAGRYAFLTEDPTAFLFLPYLQVYRPAMALHARAPGAEAAVLRAIAEEVRRLDPDVALGMAVPMSQLVGTALFPQRLAAQLVGAFGVVGLILAGLGIYGVLAYQVSRRTRELGVRRALGATSARLVRTVVGRGSLIAAVGCAAGMSLGAGMALVARSFLFGIHPLDPVTFTAVPAVLLAVALLASWLPAHQASAVQPSGALRVE
jgi:predicted permease